MQQNALKVTAIKMETQQFPWKMQEMAVLFSLFVTCTETGLVIPLNAALQFWNPTMASFMQKVKKLSTLDIFLLDFHNKLI